MKTLNKSVFTIILLALFSTPVFAAGGGGSNLNLGKVDIQLGNTASLQRGAKYFVNYCLSCHPSQHSRYKRVADDLEIREDLMIENMIFTGQKFGDLMTVAMKREDAKAWFLGVDPPDLSTHVRAIGPQAVYNFLMSFYIDESRPFGVNNLHLDNTAMPHVLAELQGLQHAEFRMNDDGKGGKKKEFEKFELVQPGKLSEAEYKEVVTDLVNFLAYLSEPAQLVRKKIGTGVLFFLALLGIMAFFLKKNYWKDIH